MELEEEEEQRATDQLAEEDSLLEEEEQKATDQPEEEDSLLLEEEERATDQPEEELIERQGEFVISVLGEINMLLSIL